MIQPLRHVVLPSSARAESFCQINDFDLTKTNVLPVAAMGPAVAGKSRYFRDKFSIPDDHLVVVYSGNFQPWFQCLEMITAMRTCRTPHTLVMHTWNQGATSGKYFKEMVSHASGMPVHFSSDYIDYDDLPGALSSADVGLAFYESIDDNFTEIVFSSNKIGEYLKAGLPIICSDYPSLARFVRENGIGFAVPVQNLAQAVERIAGRIGDYRGHALTCYEDKFRFETSFNAFYRTIFSKGTGPS
jgi:glycosyltransferase involved in cell wall biosynthesis